MVLLADLLSRVHEIMVNDGITMALPLGRLFNRPEENNSSLVRAANFLPLELKEKEKEE